VCEAQASQLIGVVDMRTAVNKAGLMFRASTASRRLLFLAAGTSVRRVRLESSTGKDAMEKSTIDALGKGLKREFEPPEDLPAPLQRALEALRRLPRDSKEELPSETPPKATGGH
jgi:hypothetical protein